MFISSSLSGCTCLVGGACWSCHRGVESEERGLLVVGVSLGAAHDVGKGELPVLLHGPEAKVFTAEEQQCVEQDDRGVGPELFTLPQELFLHPRVDIP